jgi:hypothetical protein
MPLQGQPQGREDLAADRGIWKELSRGLAHGKSGMIARNLAGQRRKRKRPVTSPSDCRKSWPTQGWAHAESARNTSFKEESPLTGRLYAS